MPSVQYSKGFLAFLIWQVWLPSFVSSQSSTVPTASESSTMGMATSSVSMTSDSTATTNAMASMMTSNSVSASASMQSSTMPVASTTAATTSGASVTSVATMSTSAKMVSTSVASTLTTDSTSMSSVSMSSPDYSIMESSNSSMISCRSFNCDASNCYSMFMNTNSSACPSTSAYCELRRWNESMYSVRCADSCDLNSTGCTNDSQINCVKNCCNMTDCLSATLQTMGNTPNITVASTTKPAMTTMRPTTKPAAMQNNGKKCKGLTCTGTDCYKTAQVEMTWCYDPQGHCELKKTTQGSAMIWRAGCATDCTKETACTSSTATCHQECCVASAAGDCLKLDGSVGMPNSEGYRVIFSPFMLLATSMMAWLIMGEQL